MLPVAWTITRNALAIRCQGEIDIQAYRPTGLVGVDKEAA